MSLLKSEPFAAVESMDELLAIAYAMEQEAIIGYSELAERMRREGRPDMVPVFERLIGEESQHLGNVVHWSERISGRKPDLAKLKWEPAETFDDEGASTIAPERLSGYRAFSMAVRNEERAFLFWTYVAAQTDQDRLREAAEQMAREELGHLATLRRERRRAFHAEKRAGVQATALDLPELELRLTTTGDLGGAGARALDRSHTQAVRCLASAAEWHRSRSVRPCRSALRTGARLLSRFRRETARRGRTQPRPAVCRRGGGMPLAVARDDEVSRLIRPPRLRHRAKQLHWCQDSPVVLRR